VILINLLPHRQERRQRRKIAFFAGLGAAAVVGLIIIALWYFVLQHMISNQQQRNQFLSAEITRLESQIKDIATLKAEIEALKARQQAVEDLQGDRNQPVYLLDELVRQTPEGVYLKSFKQDGQKVLLSGVAQSQERVAELLRNLSGNSPWLERPDLAEVRAATLAQSKTGHKVVEFTLNVFIKRAREKEEIAKENARPGPKT
jgi:type IV pilus assembly protein PilN